MTQPGKEDERSIWLGLLESKPAKWLLSIFSATTDIPYTADEFAAAARKSRSPSVIVFIAIVFWLYLIVLVGLSAHILIFSKDTLFNVSAITEKAEVRPYPGALYPDWSLENATIVDDFSNTEVAFSGTISIDDSSHISFERVGRGDAFISIETDGSNSAIMFHEDDTIGELGPSALIQLDIESGPIALPVDGVISVGQTIREGMSPSPVLLSGDVTISDKAVISREYYLTSPKKLRTGDAFAIHNPTTQSSGFVRFFGEEGFAISYNGKGEAGVISRYKSESVYLHNSIWLKLANDNTLAIFWVVLLVFYAGAKTLIRLNFEQAV